MAKKRRNPTLGRVDKTHYPLVSVQAIAEGRWPRPRAAVKGKVTMVRPEPDGDIHFRLSDGLAELVCEIVPEYPLKPPIVGSNPTVYGIVRYDGEHSWWELHPVFEID